MYGDSDQIRRRGSQLRDQGADVRSLADQLVARTEALAWTGRAADAMRERIAERANHLRTAAEAHVGAADLLDKHAAEVDRVKEEIAAIEARAQRLIEDGQLSSFVPPAPGHRDWLTVELPGL